MEIRLATTEDIEGIRALMRKYHRDTIYDGRTDAADSYTRKFIV
jgi:N-acetylglutamate synthase-like GNAT family acetyltransferase